MLIARTSRNLKKQKRNKKIEMPGFTKREMILMRKLNTPAKVQDFLSRFRFNFEEKGETLKSPLFTLRAQKAHCFEGALLGGYMLSLQGFTPYLMHLKATRGDYDHVIAPFKIGKYWGALSKTNHSVLRYRDAIYKNIRELAMSYFHEYFLDNGKKTLRQYSALLNLNNLNKNWTTTEGDLWWLDKKLDKIKHFNIVPKFYIKKLRPADKVEITSGKIVEYKR